MPFLKTLKSHHLTLLAGVPTTQIHWRLFGLLTVFVLASAGVLFGVFGKELLDMILPVYEAETDLPFPIASEFLPWVFGLLTVLDVVFEFMWIALFAWITRKVLMYYKKPLGFTHVFNIYLLVRVYEIAVSFAIVLGMTVASLAAEEPILWLTDDSGGLLGTVTSFIIPIAFFWLYIWSVRHVTNTLPKTT